MRANQTSDHTHTLLLCILFIHLNVKQLHIVAIAYFKVIFSLSFRLDVRFFALEGVTKNSLGHVLVLFQISLLKLLKPFKPMFKLELWLHL